MKITSIEKVTSWIVTTDEEKYYVYRRCNPNHWEIAMGESWEQEYDCVEIEKLFQEFLKSTS